MKKILAVIICLLLLLPVSADNAQAQITSFDTVYTVSADGVCNVTATLSVTFPDGATSFLLPLPAAAEQITAPGLEFTQTALEDRLLLVVTKADGFSSSDTVTVSYRLPQTVESWDGKQTMTLPLLYDDWNCEISSYRVQLKLPGETDVAPVIADADDDTVKNFLFVTSDASQLTLETGGRTFRPEYTVLKMEFRDGFFSQLADNATEVTPETTQITSLDVDCTVLTDSSCSVTFDAEYAFYGSPSTVCIPVPSDAYEISVGGMQFSKKRSNDCTVLVLNSPTGFTGTQTFQVAYRLLTTAVEENGKQQFSLPIIYSPWEYSIRTLSFRLTMPSEVAQLPVFVSSYYNDQIDNFLDIQLSGDCVLTQSLQPMMEQESLEVKLSLPAGYFDLRFLQGRFSALETVLFWFAAALCVLYWFFFLRNRFHAISPESCAPLGCNAGQIPYLLRLKPPSLGLMIVSWASLGYLTMERTRAKQIFLMPRIDMWNERSRCEIQLFSTLFAQKDECRVHAPAFASAALSCESLTQEDWNSRLLRKRSFGSILPLNALGVIAGLFAMLFVFDRVVTPQSFRWLLIVPLSVLGTVCSLQLQKAAGLLFERHPQKGRLLVCSALLLLLILGAASGSFAITLMNCVLQILIGFVTLPGVRRSAGGISIFYRLLGLRKYLHKLTASEIDTLLGNDSQYYYRVLPYAEALGIGAQFTKKFASYRLEPCHWLNWKGQTFDRAEDFYRRFSLLLDEMEGKKKPTRKFSYKKLL